MTLREHYRMLEDSLGVITAEHLPLCSRGWIACGPNGDGDPEGQAIVEKEGKLVTKMVLLTRGLDTLPEYYIALHELGHIAAYDASGKSRFRDDQVIEEETAAWRWAIKHALEPPTQEVWRLIYDRFITYITEPAFRLLQDAERNMQHVPITW